MKKRSIILKCLSILCAVSVLLSSSAYAVNGMFLQDNDNNYFKYINGFADNTVKPDASLTRAQAAKMLYYVLQLEQSSESSDFEDVQDSYWGYKAISAMSANGIFKGYDGNVFKPDASLTRAEFSTVIARALELDYENETDIVFFDTIGHWAEKYIASLYKNGYISGYGNGMFKPERHITRAEAVKIINKAVGMKVDQTKTELHFTDLPQSHWAYYEIMSAVSSTALEVYPQREGVKFSDIEYMSLSDGDYKVFAKQLIDEFPGATTERKAEVFKELFLLQMEINHAVTMTTINANRDVSNQEYQDDYRMIATARGAITDIYSQQYNCLADVPDRDAVCEILEITFDQLPLPGNTSDSQLVSLYEEETKYVSEFNTLYNLPRITYNGNKYSLGQAMQSSNYNLRKKALDEYLILENDINTIFDKLVDVRTRIANYYNFPNYYAFSYEYNYNNMEIFREQVKRYIVPLMSRIQLAYLYNQYSLEQYIPLSTDFLSINDDLSGTVTEILRDFSPQTRQAIDFLSEYELIDIAHDSNKSTSAFTVYIDMYEMPYILFSGDGGYNDVSTLSHEFGHAFQFFRWYENNPNSNIPIDVAEFASTGMELLMTSRYDELFGEYADDAERYQIYSFLYMIVNTCMLDEFQCLVYAYPEMTPEERNQLYRELDEEYFGVYTDSAHEAYKKGLIWSNPVHIYESPFYMIEYALSGSVALQLWGEAQTDFDSAFEKYMSMIESNYVKFGIAALTAGADLKSPFAPDALYEVSQTVSALFKK